MAPIVPSQPDDGPPPLRVIHYTRVSTDEQALSGLGLEGQDAALERARAYRGWELVATISDEGVSGSTLQRPGLLRALRMIVAGDADALVAAKLDRLSRSVSDFSRLLEWFEDAGAALIMLEPEVDTSTPAGRVVVHVLMAFAQFERDMIALRTKTALAAKRARGESIGRPAIVDRPELAARIRAMRDAEPPMTFQAIADQLNAERIPTARGAALWRTSSVQAAAGYRRPPAPRQRAGLPVITRRRRAA